MDLYNVRLVQRDKDLRGAMMKKKRNSRRSYEDKIDRILLKAFGNRANRVGWGIPGVEAMRRIESAHKRKLDKKDAWELGFQMGDWGRDAARILILHLYPEKFTPSEIRALVTNVLVHIPNHIAAAAEIADLPITDTWGTLARKRKQRKAKGARAKP